MLNLKLDIARIEDRDISQIHSVWSSMKKYKCFSTCSETVKNCNNPAQYLKLATVVVVNILRVIVSLETKKCYLCGCQQSKYIGLSQ